MELNANEKTEAFCQMNEALGVANFYADMLGQTRPTVEITELRAALTAAQNLIAAQQAQLEAAQERNEKMRVALARCLIYLNDAVWQFETRNLFQTAAPFKTQANAVSELLDS